LTKFYTELLNIYEEFDEEEYKLQPDCAEDKNAEKSEDEADK